MNGARPFGDGPQQVDLAHFLQRAAIPGAEGGRAANDENGTAREISVGYARNAVGDAGTGGQQGYTGRARAFCPAFSRVDSRLFVARVHHTDALAQTAIVNRGNMTTAEGEDDFDPLSFKYFSDQPAAVYHAQSETPFLLLGVNRPITCFLFQNTLYAIRAVGRFPDRSSSINWLCPNLLWSILPG